MSDDEESDRLWKRYEALYVRLQKRNAIIAEKVLGWKKYPVGNAGQEAYAESQQQADRTRLGDDLSRWVDEAVDRMEAAL